ncbi:hypothetical protein AX17_001733 [Amanita inopinata Kibby_2008]|nr:hypothetical protein AX17_001733 [Amanita inopinata Kibby_2008]
MSDSSEGLDSSFASKIGWPATSALVIFLTLDYSVFSAHKSVRHASLQATLDCESYTNPADTYYMAFPNDRLVVKSLVYGVFLLGIVQTVFAAHDMFKVFATGYGMIGTLDDIHFLWLTIPVLGGITGCIGQLFFAYRISLLSGSPIIVGLIVLLSVCALTAAVYTGVEMYMEEKLAIVFQSTESYVAYGLWNASAALCDVLIAAFMTYYLSRKSTAFRSTNRLITKLIRLTIETGLLTATAAITCVIFLVGLRHNRLAAYFAVPGIPISKLYSNTLLAILNSRARIYGGRNPPADFHDSSSPWEPNEGEDYFSSRVSAGTAEICVTRTVEIWNPEDRSRTLDVSVF